MKKLVTLFILLCLITLTGYSQVPGYFNYQAVVRNTAGEVINNTDVSFRISILQNSETGAAVYVEKHNIRTNNFGLVNLKIGSGMVVSGSFNPANWGTNSHFIKVEMDASGGTSYAEFGTSQLVSVPYAFLAKNVENDEVNDADSDPENEIQTLSVSGNELSISEGNTVALPLGGSSLWTASGSNVFYTGGYVGIGTSTPYYNLALGGQGAELSFQDAATGAASGLTWRENGNTLKASLNYYGPDVALNLSNQAIGGDVFINAKDRIELQNDGTTHMTIQHNGFVGIGTTEPSSSLTIHSGINAPGVRLLNNSSGNTIYDGLLMGFNSGGAYIHNYENTSLKFSTNDKYRMTITGDGNVGIGTTAPTDLLTINGGDNPSRMRLVNNFWGTTSNDGLDIAVTSMGAYLFNHESSPLFFGTNNSYRMTVAANGYVGVGTTTPSAGLHIRGTGFPSSFMYIQSDDEQDAGIRLYEGTTAQWHIFNNSAAGGLQIYNSGASTAIFAKQSNSYVGIRTTNPTYALHVNGDAAKTTGSTAWIISSDKRLKDIHGTYDKGLTEILALQPIRYNYKEDNLRQLPSEEEQVGFIAQDVQKVFPEAVNQQEDGYLDFNIHSINVAMVNAIKDLNEENMQLKNKVDELESRLQQLESIFQASASK